MSHFSQPTESTPCMPSTALAAESTKVGVPVTVTDVPGTAKEPALFEKKGCAWRQGQEWQRKMAASLPAAHLHWQSALHASWEVVKPS